MKNKIITKEKVSDMIQKHFGNVKNEKEFIQELFLQDSHFRDNVMTVGYNWTEISDTDNLEEDFEFSLGNRTDEVCHSMRVKSHNGTLKNEIVFNAKFSGNEEWVNQITIKKGIDDNHFISLEKPDYGYHSKPFTIDDFTALKNLEFSIGHISKYFK